MRVVGRVEGGPDGREHRLGLERWARGGTRLRLDGENVRRIAELARVLPVVAVHPESHELIAGGPGERRRLLDLGLFHVEQGFHGTWQRYRRALGHRNALLRAGRADREVAIWEAEMGARGDEIDSLRRRYVEDLAPRVKRLARGILAGRDALAIEYRPGWRAGVPLTEALGASRKRDREQLGTSVGPHRADLAIRLDGMDVRQRVSRGQQKLLVYVLRLAQAEQLGSGGCALLLDDLPAELDSERRLGVLRAALEVGAQLFVTTLDSQSVPEAGALSRKVFHVEQGRVCEVIQWIG